MARSTKQMLAEALASLAENDADAARRVRRADEHVDDLQKEMFAWVHHEIPAHVDETSAAIEILSIARKLERIADLATNIAEDVIFLVEGAIVRHSKESSRFRRRRVRIGIHAVVVLEAFVADPGFVVDSQIADACTLPARFYADAGVYETVRERIFARSWQLVCDVDAVRTPQQVHPFTFLEGCVDEPLVLTRDEDDRLHCLSNVCTHRGSLVALEDARCAQLRCRYHGRRFGLDGTFRHMPEFDGVTGFPSPADDLPRVPFGEWGPFVFAAIQPAFSLDEWLGDVQARVGWMPLSESRFAPERSRDYLVQANWALYCDNYLEGFHIPFVHSGLNAAIDYASYRTELHRYSNVQIATTKGGDHVFDLPPSSPDHGRVAGYYYWLFPNLMLNFYPWGLSINIVRPLAVDLTKVSFLTYVWDESKLERGAGAQLDRVEREDEAVVEAVQRGVRSRLYDRGRYSPTREQGVHHFHRLVESFLAGGTAPAP